jgi:hypothetical protein
MISSAGSTIRAWAWKGTIIVVWLELAFAAEMTHSRYQGWETYRLSNGIVTLQVAPSLGGRLIQYSLGPHNFLWANPALAGQRPPSSGLAPDGSFLNWGGDKLWPAPQGWENPEQWPGPPDAVLDGSPYDATRLPGPALQLTSQKDARSGIQFSRVVKLEDGSSILHVHATMKNVDTKPRSWGIWTNTQLDARNANGNGFNPDFWAYIPTNPRSHFPNGYKVLFGSETNPELRYDPQAHIMRVHYQRQVGKVVMDSTAGWVANVDGNTGYVFVQTFRYEANRDYPDGASVEYWTNGLGKIFAWNKDVIQSESPVENPYVAETELISPYGHLQPGEISSFDYEWRVTNIGGDYPILDCTRLACTSAPLKWEPASNSAVRLTGRLGDFYAGKAGLVFLDGHGHPLGDEVVKPIGPDKPFLPADVFGPVRPPHGAATAVLYLYDQAGKKIGELGRARNNNDN